jgi:hypothetical protein
MDVRDTFAQPGVGEVAIAGRAMKPCVEARARHAQYSAKKRDRMVGPLRRDEAKALHRVSLSFAKEAAAFFRISRSCRRVRTSRRSSRSSERSSLVRPGSSPRSIFYCLTQSLSDLYEAPSSRAISRAGRPLARTSATASARNCSGYGRRYGILDKDTDPSGQVGHCRPGA